MLNTALLFLIFKRPDVTAQVFEVIRKARPVRLYIAADGARTNQPDDAEKVAKTRDIVLNGIDWPCEVKTLFRESNLGCRMAVSSAIDWFFEHEEEGIVLEDDCLPDLTFFSFCSELLEKYRDDSRIMAISGDNFQQGQSRTEYSYYFSRYPHCWGWATWKRAWKYYDGTLSSWLEIKKGKILHDILYSNEIIVSYWVNNFDRCYNKKIDTWSYIWTYSCWIQNGLTILPDKNLVSNIGFNKDATHTKNIKSKNAFIEKHSVEFPLRHPFFVSRNVIADNFFEKNLIKRKHISILLSVFIERLIRIFCSNQQSVDTKKIAILDIEKRRLKKIPRYTRVTTELFGTTIVSNDSCTLLSDVYSIIEKEIYKFQPKKDNPLILDCGSNIGISIFYFKKLFKKSKVIAFEPDPVLFKYLENNIESLKLNDVELNNAAVWINNYGVRFYSEGGHSGHICSSDKNHCEKIISIPSVRLKSILDSLENIDMLKMDIEGAEEEVLLDCGESLKKCDYIFIEYHSNRETRQQLHVILNLFSTFGYRYHVTKAFTRKQPFVDRNCIVNMDMQLNLFFYKS